MKKYVLFACAALAEVVFAQPASRLVPAIVQSVENTKPGLWKLTVQKPEGLSLKDSVGFLVGTYASSPYRNRDISVVYIEEIPDNNMMASASTYDELKQGDVVLLNNAMSEKIDFKGKFYGAALNGIFLSSSEGQPYYTWSQVESMTKSQEDQLVSKMLTDIKKMEPGSGATISSVQNLLTSFERVAQIYYGRNLNLNDEYSNWAKSGSIDYSIIDQFVSALPKESDFENARKSRAQSITRDFLINIANGANVKYIAGGSQETYLKTMVAVSRLAPHVLSGEDLGYVHFYTGAALDVDRKYKDALGQYILSAEAYKNSDETQYARAIIRQAECARLLGSFEKSGELFSKGVSLWQKAIAKKPNFYNYSRLRISLEGLAACASELDQHQQYISAYQELIGIYKKLNLVYEKGNAYWNIAYAHGAKLQQVPQSNQNYERAYQVFDSIKSVLNAVTVLCNQAVNFRSLKNYKSAHEIGLRAEAYAKANLNSEAEGYALNNIMATFKAEGKNDKALEIAHKTETLYATVGLTRKLATVKDEIAALCEELAKPEEAIKASEEALALYQKVGTEKELADAQWNVGYYIGIRNNRVEESNALYKKAFTYYKSESAQSAATLLSNIGVNYRQLGLKEKSYQAHQEAIEYALSVKDTSAIITSLERLFYSTNYFEDHDETGEMGLAIARIYLTQGNLEKAKEWGNKVVTEMDKAISGNVGSKVKAALAKNKGYNFLGDDKMAANALAQAGDYSSSWPDALVHYKKAVAVLSPLNDPQLVNILIEMAKGYKELKQADSAKVVADKALSVALHIKDDDRISRAYRIQAYLLEPQNPDEALKLYAKAESIGGIDERMAAKKNKGKLLLAMKQYDRAANTHKERLANPSTSNSLDDIHWDLGYTLSFIPSRLKESNENYLKASAIYKKRQDWNNYVLVMNNIAINYRDAKDSVNCYKIGREVLSAVKPKLPNADEAKHYYKALDNLAGYYKTFGHHTKALKTRLEAAEGFALLGNSDKAFLAYEEAGKSANEVKQYPLAEKYFLMAKDIGDKLGDKAKVGSALWNQAYNKGTYQLKSKEALAIWEAAYAAYMEAGDTANASVMRSNVGQEQWTLLDFDKAIENHTKAIALATKGKNLSQVAYSWRKLADLYKKTANPTKQSEATNNAIKMLEILKDTVELLPAYFDIGSSYSESQEMEKAEDYFNRALKLASIKKDSASIASAYYKFAGLYQAKKPDLAMDYYRKAIPLQRRLNDKVNLVYTLASYAAISNLQQPLNEALKIGEELKDNYIIAYCHSRMYYHYRDSGKPDVAHLHMDKSNSMYEKLDNKASLIGNYISYANEYLYDYGDFVKAQKYLESAKSLIEPTTSPLTMADFYYQQSNIYADQGQYDLAIAELDKTNEIYERLKNEWGLASLYIGYGNIYKSLGEYGTAMKYQSKSDSLYNALNIQYQRMAPIANMGDIYFEQGDYPKALEHFKRSLKLMEDNQDQNTNLCKMFSAIGLTNSNMTNYEEAEKWLMKGLETSRKINATRVGADILNYLGKLKIETKKYEEAGKYLLEAKAFLVTQKLMIERTTNATQLGHLYLQRGELEKAKTELTEAIMLAEKFGKDATLWESYFRMGVYHRKTNNLKESKNYLAKSVGVIEKLRNKIVGGEEAQKLFSSDKWILEAYEELISVLLELGETEEAMAWLQKINENNVRDKIRSMDVTFENEEKNKALTREKELKMKLDAMEKQIAASKQAKNTNAEQIRSMEATRNIAEGDYLKFVNQTINVQPELSKYFSNTVQPSQLKGKKKQIPNDMALVSYLVGEKQLYIFVATSDTVVARIVPITKEKIHRDVNAMMNLTKSHLGNFGTIDLKTHEAERKEVVKGPTQTDPTLKPFEEAYHYLITPISEVISNKARLGIIPTGELNYIPFQMLGKTLKNNKFSMLVNQFSMFYTNSTDMLLRNVSGVKEMNILAFGNPDKTLPATEKEVNDIKKIFPNTKVYVQSEASEDKAKYASEEFNVMHFATHGNLDYEDFSKSYLTMAGNPGKNEDGMLTLEELWGMEVMSHLNIVVLSACQTAVTKGSDESSPVSPASGFLQNGVKSVIATLWKVDDEATAILMNEFYKNIKTMDAVDAMRGAQSHLSNIPKFNHPYYWAAMVLIGDWR
jgi:CHAT domain-containing protein